MTFTVVGVNEPWLCQEVVSERTGRFLYQIDLLPLYGSELELRGGRFARFVAEDRDHRIAIVREGLSAAALTHWLRNVVEWIAEHSDGEWSMRIEVHSVSRLTFHFSFENDATAVTFALCWSGA